MEKSLVTKLPDFNPLKEVKKQFMKMKADKAGFKKDLSLIEVYQKAQQKEKEAEKFYMDKSKEANDPGQKALLVEMAGEEGRHFIILENIIEFSKGPSAYLESEILNTLERE